MPRQIKRGEIYTVDLEPVRGSEQGKSRPCVVIQNDIGNQYAPTVIVAPLTTGSESKFRVNVLVKAPEGGLKRDSLVLLNQIRTVDKERLGKKWGQLDTETIKLVDSAIQISLGL